MYGEFCAPFILSLPTLSSYVTTVHYQTQKTGTGTNRKD